MKKIVSLLLVSILAMAVSTRAVSIHKSKPLPKSSPKELVGKNRQVVNAPRADMAAVPRVKAPKAGAEVVTPPSTLETSKYRLNGYIYDGDSWELVSRQLQVGWDGNDVYVQGFSVLLPDAWIMGELDPDMMTVTFGMQYFGNYSGNDSYFFPVTTEGGDQFTPISAVFNYNAEAGTLVLSQDVVCYIIENSTTDQLLWYYQYDSEMSIVPDADSVEVPDDLETQEYALSGVYMGNNDSDGWFEGDPLLTSAKVGFDGDDIYVQGLCSYLPASWVKGHREGDGYVFENGQYFGTYIHSGEAYPLYLVGCDPTTIAATPLVLTPNEETGALEAGQWCGIASSADEDAMWYDLLAHVVLNPIADEPAIPADPSVLYYEYEPEDGYGYAMLSVPTTDADGAPLLTGKLGYRLYCDYGNGAEPYIFTADNYGFDEDRTIIDYNRSDEINFFMGGELVVVYDIADGLQRLGVQSVYTGGDETNASQIGWYNVAENEKTEVTLPEDVEALTYVLTAQDLQFGEEYAEDRTADVRVGFDGDDVYIQGLSKWIPEAWVKGKMSEDGTEAVFPKHFLGYFSAWDIDMEIVFNGATFAYDPETDTFTSVEGYTSTSSYDLYGEHAEEDADVFSNVVITRANDAPATPAAPKIVGFELNEGYGYELFLDIPLEDVDGNPIFASKLSYQLFSMVDGEASPIVLEADRYEYATEDLTIIPYLYTDYWEVMQGGETVYVHADGIDTWEAIGAKSIYTGGGETHESPITWFALKISGVTDINAERAKVLPVYDLMGRPVDAGNLRPGIYVRQDGHKILVK